MRTAYYIFAFTLIALLSACGANSEKSEAPAKQTQSAVKPAKKNLGVDNGLHPILEKVLTQCYKIEYVFYKEGYTFSTEAEGDQAVRNFYFYISPERFEKQKCKYDGGAVFRGNDESIKMEVDFVLDEACQHVRVRVEGNTYYQKITPQGIKGLMQYFSINPQQGTPIAK